MSKQPVPDTTIEEIGEFAGKVGHDLNNILGSIRGCVDIMRGRLAKLHPEANPVERQLAIIEAALRRGVQLTSHMRSYPRRGPLATNGESARTLLDAVASQVAKRDLAVPLRIECDEALCIECNAVATENLLLALIENAMQAVAGREGGIVSVITQAHGDGFVAISIEDNGPGIAPQVLANLFDRGQSTRRSEIGTGFGMTFPVAKALMAKQGGSVEVNSTPEVGTVVSLRFRAAKAAS